jgi:amino acid adenylation domain-containing protein
MKDGLYPLSFPQRMFWLLDQFAPETPAYNLLQAFKIRGPLDVQLMRGVFRALLHRHDMLRTSFIAQDGELFQRVHSDVDIDVNLRNLSHLPVSLAEVEALKIASEEARKPFDFEYPPLLRVMLLRLRPEEHVLVLVMHHIISDGWSMSIFSKDIAELYGELALGRQPQFVPLPVRYTDFAQWQRQQFAGGAPEKEVAYWQNKLRGSPALLELPTDRPRPAAQGHRGSIESFRIDNVQTGRLKELCARERITPYMALLAVFQVLLSRYTGKYDIPVGTPVAGRNHPEIANLVGCFINVLVLRGDLGGYPRFRELLARVRAVALEAYAHQDLPFELLLAGLKCERTPSHTPLFQVMFILQNAPRSVIRLPGLVVEELELHSGLVKFDLTLEIVEDADGLDCQLEYRSDLFQRSTIERMARHFRNLLGSAIENPARPIAELNLLGELERNQLLVDWNATTAEYPRDLTIPRAFEEQVRRTPDAIALVDGFQRITYREVERRANQVANALIQRGVRPEMPVGVYMKRSAEAIIAILGAIKAGGLYVPLDTSQPKHRLHLLIRTGDCRTVLTHRALQHDLPAPVNPILLDPDEALWAKSSGSLPPSPSGQLAYIIFTSGSTGVPKGVVGTHRATMNRLAWMYETYPFSPDEVCCQKTALGFVDSVWEIFGPLLRGIPNVIILEDVVIDPELLLELLAREQVTRIVLVPTLLRVLLEHAPDLNTRLPMLKLWTVSGEYLPLDLAKKFRDVLPEAVLLNLYGSSEVAGDATFYEVGELDGLAAIPIGKPIANTRAYILDDFVQPVPIGVHGTLYVSGDCVSKGYWRRPDLTSERFVPSPFGAKSGTVFVTGDRARFLPDGNIEYLGRLDTQIKLRGFRVELGEIEANLVAHPSVRQAAATVAGHDADTRQLVAYVVGRDGAAPPSQELRNFLGGRLPQYMVPAVFVELAELPLLPSGKVDRGSLPQPPSGVGQAGENFGPRNDVETRLVSIWRERLSVEELGVTENFFALGGNSLLAMQVLARVREAYEVEISIRSLFDRPTIEELAREIERAKASGAVARTPRIIPRARPSVEEISAELARLSPEQIEMLLQRVRR